MILPLSISATQVSFPVFHIQEKDCRYPMDTFRLEDSVLAFPMPPLYESGKWRLWTWLLQHFCYDLPSHNALFYFVLIYDERPRLQNYMRECKISSDEGSSLSRRVADGSHFIIAFIPCHSTHRNTFCF